MSAMHGGWTQEDAPKRVLVITAHPDDMDFGASGTIAQLSAAGAEVSYCVLTNGDAGGSDRSILRSEIPTIRQAEQRAAAAVLGVFDLHFLGYPDGDLEITKGLRRDISRVIRQVRPELVIAQSPERNWARIGISHPDHLTAGEAALRAIYPDARNPFAHPELLGEEGLEPWSVPETWLMLSPQSDRFVDITEQFEKKIEAISCHASQLEEMGGALRDRMTEWGLMMGQRAGFPEGRIAEAFHVVDTR